MVSAIATPNRQHVTEIYVGGAADTKTRLVATYAEERQRRFAQDAFRDARYFPHHAPRRILRLARQRADMGHLIVLTGHSWGGDTALRVLRALHPRPVDLLVCVDPVPKSRLNPPPAPRNAARIIHVDARPRLPNRSDRIKDMGQWVGGTLHRRLSGADLRIIADLNHFAFAQMMHMPGEDGVSAAYLIEQMGQVRPGPAAKTSLAG